MTTCYKYYNGSEFHPLHKVERASDETCSLCGHSCTELSSCSSRYWHLEGEWLETHPKDLALPNTSNLFARISVCDRCYDKFHLEMRNGSLLSVKGGSFALQDSTRANY